MDNVGRVVAGEAYRHLVDVLAERHLLLLDPDVGVLRLEGLDEFGPVFRIARLLELPRRELELDGLGLCARDRSEACTTGSQQPRGDPLDDHGSSLGDLPVNAPGYSWSL
jgi:hypothetical protein